MLRKRPFEDVLSSVKCSNVKNLRIATRPQFWFQAAPGLALVRDFAAHVVGLTIPAFGARLHSIECSRQNTAFRAH